MKDTDKTGNKIFGFVQGEKEFFYDIGNSLKETVKQAAIFEEKMTERIINGENKMPVCTVNQFEGHGSRPVIGILSTAGRAELGVTSERDKFKSTTVRAAIHGTSIRGITTVDYLFDVFHDNRSWSKVIFNNLIIIFKHLLYHIHEIIMKQSREESKPFPLKIEG